MKKAIQILKCWPYVIGYVMFLVFYKVTPIFFDMWVQKTDYIVRDSNFVGVLKAVFFTGGCWKNARYLANIINIYIVSYEWISDFMIPLVFVVSIAIIQRMLKVKNCWPVVLMGIGLLFDVSDGIVGQVYSYSYVLFLFPILFCVSTIYCLERYMDNKDFLTPLYRKILFVILVYLNACFLENVSCAFTVTIVGYYIRDKFVLKRKGKLLLGCSLLSLAQTLYMNLYLIILKTRPLNEDGVGLFERVVRNGRILLIETWIYNEEIIFCFLIALLLSIVVSNNNIVSKKKKWLLCGNIFLLIIYGVYILMIYQAGGIDGITSSIAYNFNVPYLPFSFRTFQTIVFVVINFYILYMVYLIDSKLSVMFWMGGCSLIPVLITPNTGWRISSFYVFMIIYVAIGLLMKTVGAEKGWINRIVIFLGLLVFIYSGFAYVERVGRIEKVSNTIKAEVENVKQLQLNDNWNIQKDIMYLPEFDSRDVLYEGRPDLNPYYMWNFCIANELNKETIVITN